MKEMKRIICLYIFVYISLLKFVIFNVIIEFIKFSFFSEKNEII